jgi:hypothetical protein
LLALFVSALKWIECPIYQTTSKTAGQRAWSNATLSVQMKSYVVTHAARSMQYQSVKQHCDPVETDHRLRRALPADSGHRVGCRSFP